MGASGNPMRDTYNDSLEKMNKLFNQDLRESMKSPETIRKMQLGFNATSEELEKIRRENEELKVII